MEGSLDTEPRNLTSLLFVQIVLFTSNEGGTVVQTMLLSAYSQCSLNR